MDIQHKKDLTKFIDFHSRAFSTSINSIQAIVSHDDLKLELSEIFNLLQKDWVEVKYTKGMEPGKFIENLLWPLYQGKTVLVVTDTLDFDPVVYEQLIAFRENNRFTLTFALGVPIAKTSSLFLLYQDRNNDKKVWNVADHVFRTEEMN